MNIQQLRIIIELGNGRTLLEIADILSLTQPTVSFHLRKLEEELGVALVQKQYRNLRITEAATEFLPYARRIISLVEEAQTRMNERSQMTKSKLRIGASYTPATFFMPPFLQQFQSINPSTQLVITVNPANKILRMLSQFDIDVAIVSLPDTEKEGLIIKRLVEDELKLVFSPSNPLAELDNILIENVLDHTFLLHESGSTSRRLTDEWANQNGLAFHHIMELGAIETIKEAARYNIGVAVLPERSISREIASGELLMRSLPNYENRRYISLVYRNEDIISPLVRSFIDFVLEQMRDVQSN